MSKGSLFGSSYPPGCSGPPDYDDDPSPLEDAVLALLEDAGVPDEICDRICKMISDWERAKISQEDTGILWWPEDDK